MDAHAKGERARSPGRRRGRKKKRNGRKDGVMKMDRERNRGQREDTEEGGQTAADLAFIMCHRSGFIQYVHSYWRWIQYRTRGKNRRRDRHPGLNKSELSVASLRARNTSSVGG